MGARDIYIAIMRAAARGDGLRLTASECRDLSHDDAIQTAASNNLTVAEMQSIYDGKSWAKMNPYKAREPGIWFGGESKQRPTPKEPS